jgi:signal peptidase I
MKKIIKDIIPYIIIIAVVVIIRTFIATPVKVDGKSMTPTFNDGEILLLNKFDHSYQRFNVIVFQYKGEKLVKRIVGLPGETIQYENNQLYVNGELVEETFTHEVTEDFQLNTTIPAHYYFVLGDNRLDSLDSRYIGLISEDDIEGVIGFSIFPFKTIK